jgi:CheY-like chemotaxis protein
MTNMKHKHVVLYAEDDADDLFMVQQAFEKYDGAIELLHAANGFEALQQLEHAKAAGSLPCLVILDINMPGMNGKETLIRIRQSEDFKNMTVVLFTTSSSETDKAFARKWNAEFITKPLIYSELELLATTFLNLCTSVSEHA